MRRRERWSRAHPPRCPPFAPDWPANRLGLARWLVDRRNPLTARVTVNRFWQMLWGVGLVKTCEDFGSQGEWPLHPELLDWLAVEFMDSGWNVKHILKTMVMSATYRQSSRSRPQLLEKDPDNRLLARGSRFRLSAEMLRDQALAVSGLLVEKVGGPSVKPYQPPGLWQELFGGKGYVRRSGRSAIPPLALHLLAAHRGAALDDELRFAEPRGLRRARRPHQHTLAGAQPDERHHLPGGVAQARRADACAKAELDAARARVLWCWAARRGPRS